MTSRQVRFKGALGDEIVGLLDLPDGEPRAYGVFAHCFTCTKNVRVVPEIAKRLNAEGLALLRFDFTGLGQSGGSFSETTLRTNTQDLVAASTWLASEYAPPSFLVGHSLGGAAVLSVASSIPSVRCLATIAAPAEATHVRSLLAGAEFDASGVAEVRIGGRLFPLGRDLVEDLETHDVLASVGQLQRPLLVFHAPGDPVVGIDHAERIFAAARYPRGFLSLDETDHLVSDPRDAAFVGQMLATWVHRFLPASSPATPTHSPATD